MKLSAFFSALVLSAALPAFVVATDFTSVLSTTSSDMNELYSSLGELETAAVLAGNLAVVMLCGQARLSLNDARKDWSYLFYSSVTSSPSTAGSNPHALSAQSSINSCGDVLDKIQSSISGSKSSSPLKTSYDKCRTTYSNCRNGADTVCNWPRGGTGTPPPTTTSKPGPSQWKRSHHKRNLYEHANFCPAHEEACPITATSSAFECIDTTRELTSCGGCSSTGAGMDCTALEGVAGVGCEIGTCVVLSCVRGYMFDTSTGSCVLGFRGQNGNM